MPSAVYGAARCAVKTVLPESRKDAETQSKREDILRQLVVLCTAWSAWSDMERAGPGGPARTRASAPHFRRRRRAFQPPHAIISPMVRITGVLLLALLCHAADFPAAVEGD